MLDDSCLKGVILDFASMAPASLDADALFDIPKVDWTIHQQTSAQLVDERIQGADIVLTNKVVLDQAAIENAQTLKFIGVLATGMNNVDLDTCARQGIQVENAVGYGTASVAQHTLMLMLMLATNVSRYQQAVAKGDWSRSAQFCLLDYPVSELAGKHLVIVGYGTLGKAVEKLAQAFDMRVSIARRPGVHSTESSRRALDELLPEADYVSLHCALSTETHHMIDAARLKLMRKGAFLINTARGLLVDEQALVDALKDKHLAGAAVDVVAVEPPPKDNVLLNACLPNLIVTPHVAWSSVEARQRLLDQITHKLSVFVETILLP